LRVSQAAPVSYTIATNNGGPSSAQNVFAAMNLTTGSLVDFSGVSATDGAAGCSLTATHIASQNILSGTRLSGVVSLQLTAPFGYAINSIARVGGTVTVTTTGNHNFSTGDRIHILGV